MIGMKCEEQRWIYHFCLAPLQRDFVKHHSNDVKAVIRMLKYWKEEYLHRGRDDRLLNSYVLELLAIYAWERAGSPNKFDLAKGFKSVLSILAYDLRGFRYYWMSNYTAEMAERGISNIRLRIHRRK